MSVVDRVLAEALLKQRFPAVTADDLASLLGNLRELEALIDELKAKADAYDAAESWLWCPHEETVAFVSQTRGHVCGDEDCEPYAVRIVKEIEQ